MGKKKTIIEFIDTTDEIHPEFYPRPAKLTLPDWYKNTSSYKGGKKEAYMDERGFTSATMKRCMPFFDAMTSGYTLFSHIDVQVSGPEYNRLLKWPSGGALGWHARWQLGEYPEVSKNLENIPKWVNPWVVKTDPGYSCLFINPMNYGNSIFHCFEGVVDTDTFLSPVNFPFFLKNNSWEGVIPAGTPIMQVIPFRRDSFSHVISKKSDEKNKNLKSIQSLIDSIFFNAYRNHFWYRKEYD
jgi:hypothetical protein